MKFKKQIQPLVTLLRVAPRKSLGVVMILCVPLIHNLHNILSSEFLQIQVPYHVKMYYFLWIFLHSFAPCVGFLGCFLLIDSKIKSVVAIPFGYELYKGLEKLPFRENYNIHEEFAILSLMFSVFWIPIFYAIDRVTYKLNHKIRHSTATLRAITDDDLDNLYQEHGKEIIKAEVSKLEKELELLDR